MARPHRRHRRAGLPRDRARRGQRAAGAARRSPTALAAALERLAGDAALRRRFGAASRHAGRDRSRRRGGRARRRSRSTASRWRRRRLRRGEKRVDPAEQAVGDEAGPFLGDEIEQAEMRGEREIGVRRRFGAEIDGIGQHVPADLAEAADGARHMPGRGHEQPGLARLRLRERARTAPRSRRCCASGPRASDAPARRRARRGSRASPRPPCRRRAAGPRRRRRSAAASRRDSAAPARAPR